MTTSSPQPTPQDSEPKKTPEGVSLDSLRLNTDDYSTVFDTLKDHALKLVANAHSEMSDEQWNDYVNELTATYAQSLTQWANKRAEADKQALYTALVEQMPEKITDKPSDPFWKDEMSSNAKMNGYNQAIDQVDAVLSSVLGTESSHE